MLQSKIDADLKEAMKARDQVRVDTLRMLRSAINYRRIEVGHELSEDEQLEIVRKQVKQRNDAITEYERAARAEAAAKETREREILQAFLPRQLTREELEGVVREALAGLPRPLDRGMAMKVVMAKVKGVADGRTVAEIVNAELARS
ncbi:MAG TPA: GatB/YqeY domain-containing protein [Candidatus Dormibacteraeota bacterium]|nr:GatB/YqeY domain-containing protein [Candidatus Dormibacteraeota bacterium]